MAGVGLTANMRKNPADANSCAAEESVDVCYEPSADICNRERRHGMSSTGGILAAEMSNPNTRKNSYSIPK